MYNYIRYNDMGEIQPALANSIDRHRLGLTMERQDCLMSCCIGIFTSCINILVIYNIMLDGNLNMLGSYISITDRMMILDDQSLSFFNGFRPCICNGFLRYLLCSIILR